MGILLIRGARHYLTGPGRSIIEKLSSTSSEIKQMLTLESGLLLESGRRQLHHSGRDLGGCETSMLPLLL